jgi:fumarate reductase flavoprotein subunit
MDSKLLDRRSFITGASASVIGALGLGLAGCSTPSAALPPSAGSVSASADAIWALDEIGEPTETLSADLVIIGGGGTGLAAAIQAKQLGVEPIIIEKMGLPGGAYICTEGMCAFGSSLQKEAGIDIPVAYATDKCMEYHHWLPDRTIYEAFFNESGETIDWCLDIGVEYTAVVDQAQGKSFECFHIWHHQDGKSPGSQPVETLVSTVDKLGIDILLSATAKKIVMDGGKVVAVLVEKEDGTILRIDTPSALIATGGFGRNDEMLRQLAQCRATPLELGVLGRDGDGLRLGKDAGADLWDFQTVPFCGPVTTGAPWATPTWCVSVQPLLWVNHKAKRFAREDIFLENFAYAGNLTKGQERVYVILTQKDLDSFEAVGPYATIFTLATEGKPMEGLKESLKTVNDTNGSIYSADTIEELAAQIDLDVAGLTETITRYNDFCATGTDEDFAKDPTYLIPIGDGPYYALECCVGVLSTAGGLRINPKTECLASDFSVIPGLYAGGCDAGGLFGDTYDPNLAPGSQAGWAINSGRIAAKSIAKYLGK